MTRQEMDQYKDKKPVAVYPMGTWGGLEIYDILYGIDDYVVYKENFGRQEKTFHKVKIRTAPSDRHYFIYNSNKVYLDLCLRTNCPV